MKKTLPEWLATRIKHRTLSTSQSRIITALAVTPEFFIMASVKEFANAAKVAPATVTRCIRFLGYKNYEEFQHDLKNRLLQPQKLTSVYNYLDTERADGHTTSARILEAEQQTLKECVDSIDTNTLYEAAYAVGQAKRVHLIGYGSSVALLRFLQYRLMRIGLDVVDMTPVSQLNMLAEHCVHMNARKDVILTVSFRGVYETIVHLLHFAREFHIPTIAFSENPESEISHLSDYRIPIRRAVINEFKSLAAPMSIMNLFVMHVAHNLEPGKDIITRRLAWFRKYQEKHNLR